MAKIPLFTLLTIVFSSLSVPTLTAFDSATANQPKPLEIQRITPEGADVPLGRQIVFQFNQPVVPVGKMERQAAEIPITITPSVQCQWRWLNTSALACELGDKTALQKATQYHIQVQPGIMTEAKQTLAKSVEHAFITERPSVDYPSFETWRAPGMPDIRVSFNQPVTRISVETHLYMQEANGERIPVVAKLPSSDSEEATEESETPPAPVVSEPVVDATESNRWIVSPKKLLPLDAKLQLKVEPGIISILGTEAGVENEVVVEFHTFPEFKFLGIRCTDLADQSIDFLPGEKFTTNQRCDPLRQVGLLFSSPVISEVAKENLVVIPDLAGGRKDYNPWENASSGYSRLSNLHNKGDVYELWLPELLQAYQNYQIKIFNPSLFQDEFGRPLPNPVEMQFATDHRAPDYTFEHNISVLEKDVDSELPLYVTNLQKVDVEYSVLTAEGWTSTKKSAVTNIPRLQDVSVKIPFGIRQLLAETSGVVKGCFHTLPTVNDDSCESDENWQTWFFSQVTPYHVQTKIGYHNTLIWITDFATGQPVSDMNVSIYRDTYLADDESALPEILAKANTNVEGIAWLPGTETLDPELLLSNVYDRKVPRFFIRCEKEGEIALLPLDYDFRVEIYDLLGEEANWYPEMQPKYGHIHTWGTTAQGIYKVGDMIQYKFLVRDQSNKQFVPAPKDGYTLKIIDPKDKIVQEIKELSLNDFGSYAGEFAVPKTAAVGWYQFELSANFSKKIWQPMRVLVSDFTPSPFHVQTVINGDLFHLGDTVPVDTTATLHAGGPYAKAPLRLTAVLSQQDFAPTHPQAQGFQFDVYVENVNDDTVYQTEAEIDEKGQLHSSFVLPQSSPVLYGNLLVESAVQDDRGKDVAQSATAKYVGRDRFVGLKQTSWVLNALDPAEVKLIVVDAQGNPTTGTAIKVTIEHQETKASRVKGAGNAYLTQYEHEWIATGQCETISDTTPVTCTFTPPKAGAYQITAQISDTQGLPHSSRLQQWSMGKDWVVWETAPTNMLEMTAEKASYQVGETARYLVKNPYPGSMGLITIERFGTLKTWVHALPTSTEIIEVPVEADYVPGFFVSVTVMSPRVDKPINEEQVDLGKPAFRMGYAKTEVEDPYKEILVDIQTDKPVYKPHETVTVNLQAKFRHPLSSIAQEGNADAQNNEKMELAVTVLDESVYDLLAQGRDYFDPYRGFYTLDGLDMVNYSLLTRLIGRQKFEKKGATSGGDGGMGPGMRSVFKFVSYWNPSIVADADGKAQFQFTVPDNLTGWRILAMAVTPNDRMGLSDANFKVNQPIEIRPALPNQVLTGDSFYAGFTIMNRTDKAREVQVTLNVKGPAEATECALITVNCGTTHTLQTEPFKRYTVWLPLRTTQDGTLQFNVVAEDTSDKERDGLNVSLPVQKRRSMDVAATYGTTIANELRESVKFPADIYPDTGGLEVIFTPTVIGGVEGAFVYMRDYPYFCWEQKLSKGVMAAHFKNLHTYLPESVTWKGSEELPEKTLELAIDYQAPNGGMAFLVAQDDRVSPYLSAYTALAFNWLRNSGYKIPDSVENKLHEYLLTMLRKEVLPTFYSEGMTSSVRAVALA
ncbi:MAG: large extracellular alpha-helical protein, partial [Beggiatoa sp. IS2]